MNKNPKNYVFKFWKHYKNQLYQSIGLVEVFTPKKEVLVAYRSLYPNFDYWLRPKAMFDGELNYQGKLVKRFERVDPSSNPAAFQHDNIMIPKISKHNQYVGLYRAKQQHSHLVDCIGVAMHTETEEFFVLGQLLCGNYGHVAYSLAGFDVDFQKLDNPIKR